MDVKFNLVFSALLLGSLGLASATPLDDDVTAFKEALHQAVPDPSKGIVGSPETRYPAGYISQLDYITSAYETAADNVDNENGVKVVREIIIAIPQEAVQKAGQTLIAEIEKEEKARETAKENETKALLDRMATLIVSSSQPSDLDVLLADLQKANQNSPGGMSRSEDRCYQQLTSAYQFVTQWQDYLAELSSGQVDQARNALQALAQNNFAATIIPRSKLLAREASLINGPSKSIPAESVSDIVRGIKTLDEMEPALNRLISMNQVSPTNEGNQAAMTLRNYVDVYNGTKAGISTVLNNYGGQPSLDNPELFRKLMLFLIQNFLDSYQGKPPVEGEKPITFVNRVIVDAINRQDWALLRQAMTIMDYLNRNSALGSNMAYNSNQFDSLLAAINQETAGQYALAVVSYEAALKSTNPNIPAKMIGQRLAGLEKDHPKEFETGMQLVISPPPINPAYLQRGFNSYGKPGGGPLTLPARSDPIFSTNAPVTEPATTNTPPAVPVPPATNTPAAAK